MRFWHQLAEQGDAYAQNRRATACQLGDGVPQHYAEAVKWYRLSAAQGDDAGQLNLGLMYAEGQGVPRDHVLAHMWCNLAAAQDETCAAQSRDRIER